MTAADWAALVSAIAELFGAVAWPVLLAVTVLIVFKSDLRGLLRRDDVSISMFGVEIKGVAGAAANMMRAEVKRGERQDGNGEVSTSRIVEAIYEAVPDPEVLTTLRRSTVLWVDDEPDNNAYERQMLESVGVEFATATSTEEALRLLGQQQFDLVISDMARGEDGQAGYELLRRMRKAGSSRPFLIYAGSAEPHHRREARLRSAQGTTNMPHELFVMVARALSTSARGAQNG